MHLFLDSIIFSLLNSFSFFPPQRWQKSGTHLEHLVSRFCLDSEMALDGMDSSRMLVISPCELSAYTQRWEVPFSWPLTPVTFHLQKSAPSPILRLKHLGRDSCSDRVKMHEHIMSGCCVEESWTESFWCLLRTLEGLKPWFFEDLCWMETSLEEETHQKCRVCFVWRLKCLFEAVQTFAGESNQVHLKTLNCQRSELDRNFAWGKKKSSIRECVL